MAGVEVRVLFYNTFLLRAVRLPGGRWLHEKPAVEDRTREIGAAIGSGTDVVALAEVFGADDRARLLDAAGVPADRWAAGPEGDRTTLASSGLLTFAQHPLVRHEVHEYRSRGRRLLDSDAWASKGVLLTEVDLGLAGNLEVYSTHLFYGGDLVRSEARHRSPELHRIRQAQVEELLAFVDAARRPGNVALVVGDLNVDAEGRGPDGGAPPDEGQEAAAALRAAMQRAGFDDAWTLVGEGPGWTCDLLEAPPGSFVLDPADPDLCAEPAPPARPGDHLSRIDQAHLARPRPSDRLRVELRSVRRRAFPRAADAPGHDQIATMSDHLGVQLELVVDDVP